MKRTPEAPRVPAERWTPRARTAGRGLLGLGVTLVTTLGVLGSSGCTHTKEPEDLRGQDVRVMLVHTADVHSRLLPYEYAPNLPDRNLGLLTLPGVCRSDAVCSTDFGKSCTSDSDCKDSDACTADKCDVVTKASLAELFKGAMKYW